MAIDKHLKTRAKQIVAASATPMSEEDAIAQAIRERCGGDVEAAIKIAARASNGWANEIRRNGFNPDMTGLGDDAGGEQMMLPLGDFYERMPHVAGIRDENGILLFTKNSATGRMVIRWQKEGLRHYKSGLRYFTLFGEQLDATPIDPDRNFLEQLRELEGKSKADGDAA